MNANQTEIQDINQLAADLKDAWHYANLITGLNWSTFEGNREYLGLVGKCKAYGQLVAIARKLYDFDSVIPDMEQINDGNELVSFARSIQGHLHEIAEKNGIVASQGLVRAR